MSPLEKISRGVRNVIKNGRRYLLTSSFLLASCDNSLPTSIGGNSFNNSNATTQGADVKEYKYSIGFFIPENSDVDSLNDTLREKAENFITNTFLDLAVGSALPGIGILLEILDEYKSRQPTFDFYVRTQSSNEWTQNITVCPNERVYFGVVYKPGPLSNPKKYCGPHIDEGIEAAVYGSSVPVIGADLNSWTILERNEEPGCAPNFFVAKNTLIFGNFFDPTNIDYIIGERQLSVFTSTFKIGRPAVITVDLSDRCLPDLSPPDNSSDNPPYNPPDNAPPQNNDSESQVFVEEHEPNDTIRQAQEVNPRGNLERIVIINGALHNNFGPNPEKDLYSFHAEAGDRITVYIEEFGIGPEIGSLLYILPHGECQVSNPFVKGTWWDEDLVGISSIAPCTGKYAVGVQSCELYDVESWIDELPPRPQNPYCGTEREFPYTLRISVE